MTKALARDLQKLKARAFDMAERAEGVLRRYHAAILNLNDVTVQQLRVLYDWISVPPPPRYGRLMSRMCWRIALRLWKSENA